MILWGFEKKLIVVHVLAKYLILTNWLKTHFRERSCLSSWLKTLCVNPS